MTAEQKPAGFCLTEKSRAELAGLVVNNKSQPPTAGTYYQADFIPLASRQISLKLINENESSADCAVVYWWRTSESPAAL